MTALGNREGELSISQELFCGEKASYCMQHPCVAFYLARAEEGISFIMQYYVTLSDSSLVYSSLSSMLTKSMSLHAVFSTVSLSLQAHKEISYLSHRKMQPSKLAWMPSWKSFGMNPWPLLLRRKPARARKTVCSSSATLQQRAQCLLQSLQIPV